MAAVHLNSSPGITYDNPFIYTVFINGSCAVDLRWFCVITAIILLSYNGRTIALIRLYGNNLVSLY